MDLREVFRIQAFGKRGNRSAEHVLALADMDSHVIVLGLDPVNFAHIDQELPLPCSENNSTIVLGGLPRVAGRLESLDWRVRIFAGEQCCEPTRKPRCFSDAHLLAYLVHRGVESRFAE